MTVAYLRVDTATGEVTAQDGPPGSEEQADPIAGFAAWLDDLDADEVQRAALAGLSMKDKPTRAILDYLAAKLRGER